MTKDLRALWIQVNKRSLPGQTAKDFMEKKAPILFLAPCFSRILHLFLVATPQNNWDIRCSLCPRI